MNQSTFKLHSAYVPTGDQPEAIEALARVEDSTQAIDDFLQKKLTGWTGDRKQLQKVTAALARRGFSWSDIRDALARYETGIDIEYD